MASSVPKQDDQLPAEFYIDYVDEAHIAEFEKVVNAPVVKDDATGFISSKSDWRPIRQKVAKKRRRKPRKDETREGFMYSLISWPVFFLFIGWITFLGICYFLTRFYIFSYEHFVTWRGKRNRLRKKLRSAMTYDDWKTAAIELDNYLGGDQWKESDEFAYYDVGTLRKVIKELRGLREEASHGNLDAVETLSALVRACVKSNFAGTENARLYSETYYGTKNRLQEFIDELESSLMMLLETDQLGNEEKYNLFKGLHKNLGRTALCLSGGACFAYYHFGVVRAHLDAGLIPSIITGTSGGGIVAALVGTRTDEELKEIMTPALADKITACHDGIFTWSKRVWRTGARFDAVDWARRSNWFTRGSMTFKEGYERTGRILNISCVPNDPNSPSILLNHITAPDCVIWTALLASAAVPGILNPVVLMMKTKKGNLIPYSFGHKWKDGSIRTDIPLQALNLHFNVNFPIVSQVNPHITLFYFSSRGTVGRPVSHRKGRGWRGGYLGSAVEQYLKLDLNKWFKVARQLELLPRPLGTDWSTIFLQKFYGSVNILPKTKLMDYWYILSDPTRERMAFMLYSGQQASWPKLKFVSNRMKLERLIEEGRRRYRSQSSELSNILSSEDIAGLLRERKRRKERGSVRNSPRNSRASFLLQEVDTKKERENSKPSPTTMDENPTPTARKFSPTSWFAPHNWPGIADVLSSSNPQRRNSMPVTVRNDSEETIKPDSNNKEEITSTKRHRFFGDIGETSDGEGMSSAMDWTEEDTTAENTEIEDHYHDHDEDAVGQQLARENEAEQGSINFHSSEDGEDAENEEEYGDEDEGMEMMMDAKRASTGTIRGFELDNGSLTKRAKRGPSPQFFQAGPA